MYTSKNFQIRDEETFSLCIPTDRDYKILQLTDLHLGFGMFSGKKDKLALEAVTELIHRTEPDLMVLTGDSVFPFFPKSGTMNNRKQAEKLLAFLDGFQIPYTLVFGNHDWKWAPPVIRSSWRRFLPRENMRFLPKEDMSTALRIPLLVWEIL